MDEWDVHRIRRRSNPNQARDHVHSCRRPNPDQLSPTADFSAAGLCFSARPQPAPPHTGPHHPHMQCQIAAVLAPATILANQPSRPPQTAAGQPWPARPDQLAIDLPHRRTQPTPRSYLPLSHPTPVLAAAPMAPDPLWMQLLQDCQPQPRLAHPALAPSSHCRSTHLRITACRRQPPPARRVHRRQPQDPPARPVAEPASISTRSPPALRSVGPLVLCLLLPNQTHSPAHTLDPSRHSRHQPADDSSATSACPPQPAPTPAAPRRRRRRRRRLGASRAADSVRRLLTRQVVDEYIDWDPQRGYIQCAHSHAHIGTRASAPWLWIHADRASRVLLARARGMLGSV